MAILYVNGWEAGSQQWYTDSTAVWTNAGGFGSGMTNDPTFQHRTPGGVGGNYSWRPKIGIACTAAITTSARWLMWWAHPGTSDLGGMNVQFALSGVTQVNVRFGETGNVELYRGGTLIKTVTSAYTQNSPHWFAVKVVADAGAGEVEVWVDGVKVADGTGTTNWQNAASPGWDRFGFGCSIAPHGGDYFNGGAWYIDDMMVTDAATGRLGQHFAPVIKPTANGTPLNLTPSTGTNWQNVDNIPYNDGFYNQATAPGQQDFYTTAGLSIVPASIACVNVLARATGAGGITNAEAAIQNSGTNAYGMPETLPGGGYLGINYISETNPNTGLPWNAGSVNAASIGIRFS